jgi:hypothetical protein
LRAGVEAKLAAGAPAPSGRLTLEQIFLEIVGGTRAAQQELSWLA